MNKYKLYTPPSKVPSVSILMITYNHDRYIRKALESILMQNVEFIYEIVVGEDCSTDLTREILLEYKGKYPDKFKLILHDKNIGMQGNFISTYEKCIGKYIAFLEGDDFWTSRNKLQTQFEYLNANDDISECFCRANVVYDGVDKASCIFPGKLSKNVFNLEDVVSGFFIPTLTIMFRSKSINTFPHIFYQFPNPDWLIHILNSRKGNIGFIDEIVGCYRVHDGGIWSGLKRSECLSKTIEASNTVNEYLNYDFDQIIMKNISLWRCEMSEISLTDKNYTCAYRNLFMAFKAYPVDFIRFIKIFIKIRFIHLFDVVVNKIHGYK